ncbi:phytanoyl-CoA dioxygenase family protein [Nostocales cyanobacterium HT-58-2]|nr:phytanoyl-CoA dioxygenase family protein [Nostocales cyanobacterium HT-58-2]
MLDKSIHLSGEQIAQFQADGYLILEKFLNLELVDLIISKLDPLFATRFETGIYPDEWHGRPGLSVPNATRQMCGMWKCDRAIASLSLSSEIARLNATLAGWSGGRIATDSCWIKPPGAPEVAFHRNSSYATCIDPAEVMTCWIALSDTQKSVGTLELVPGSHRWNCTDKAKQLHAPKEDYCQPLLQVAARMNNLDNYKIVTVEIPPGGCVFLHWNIWHGSGRNTTLDKTRRSFGVSTFRSDARFQPFGIGYGYIFGRYRRIDSTEMDETFFPILWTKDGYRTPFLSEYCEDALSLPAMAVNY